MLPLMICLPSLPPVHASLTWSSPTLIDANSGLNLLSTGLQASNGTMWIAWQSGRNAQITGRFDILYKTYTNGVWSISRNFTTSGQNAAPALVQLGNGTVGIFWTLRVSHSYEIFYSRYNTPGWSARAQLSTANLNATQVSAAESRDAAHWLRWPRCDWTDRS